MKVAYIAGPYRANSISGVVRNINRAGEVALKYWRKGYAVICPHKNTSLFDGECEDKMWLDGDIELLRRSDIVVMMNRWQESQGATDELEWAKKLGKEIIFDE